MTTTESTPKLLTAAEFAALGDVGPVDLIRGRVVYLTRPKPRHGRVANNIAAALTSFVRPRKLGQVYGSEIGYLVERDPDTVRAPDVSFVRAELADPHDDDEWYPHAPGLAVEVLSPGDRAPEVEEKVRLWLGTGGRSVWVIDPATETVAIHRAGSGVEQVAEDGHLRDEQTLPGFSMPLRDAFRR